MKVICVLEYEGTAEWIKRTFEYNAVKRIHATPGPPGPHKGFAIRELVLGRDTPLGQRLRVVWQIVRGRYLTMVYVVMKDGRVLQYNKAETVRVENGLRRVNKRTGRCL